jgi:hypothetical protein
MLLSAWTDDWRLYDRRGEVLRTAQEKIRTSTLKKTVSEKAFDLSGTY